VGVSWWEGDVLMLAGMHIGYCPIPTFLLEFLIALSEAFLFMMSWPLLSLFGVFIACIPGRRHSKQHINGIGLARFCI